jgi:hypothetical protein
VITSQAPRLFLDDAPWPNTCVEGTVTNTATSVGSFVIEVQASSGQVSYFILRLCGRRSVRPREPGCCARQDIEPSGSLGRPPPSPSVSTTSPDRLALVGGRRGRRGVRRP